MFKQLYIGLGGQGAKSICEIKKAIYERELYALANPSSGSFNVNHAFLSIDSSPDIWNAKKAWKHMGKDLQLNRNEQCFLRSDGINITASNIVPWLYSEDPNILNQQIPIFGSIDTATPGAQQRRRYGRTLFAANANLVYQSIHNAMQRACEKDDSNCCVINVFCSLGGGTGSGGIVDLITMLRQIYPAEAIYDGIKAYPINLYLYLADENGVDPSALQGYFFENQYAALRDLNALSTGLLRPHTMTQVPGSRFYPGERNKVGTPLDAIIISTNTTSENTRISISDQIKRTAKWAIDRALITDGAADSTVAKISTGEDFTTNVHGEPNDVTDVFLERAYRFANLGSATWGAPINELVLMASHLIRINSYKQMLYNYVTDNEGYKADTLQLETRKLASYVQVNHDDFMLKDYVQEGWQAWADANADIQAILHGPRDTNALSKLENLFEDFFNKDVCNATSNDAGDRLSLPGRLSYILNVLKDRFRMGNSAATGLSTLLLDQFKMAITADWRAGALGLKQTLETISYAASAYENIKTRLEDIYGTKQNGGTELTPLLQSKELRSNRKDGEWNKLTGLSYSVMGKGKAFIQAHMEDLIEIYTIKTQCAHIAAVIREINSLITRLRDFTTNLKTPIDVLETCIQKEEETYNAIPLRRYIEEGATPSKADALKYDFDYTDSRLKSTLDHIRTNMERDYGVTIEGNARLLRDAIANSMNSIAVDSLFGSTATIDEQTETSISELSFTLAGTMLADADRRFNTNIMGGIKARVLNMSAQDFNTKFKKLLTSATFSYQTDNSTPTAVNAYGDLTMANAYRQAWIVCFPKDIQLPGIDSTDDARKAAILANAGPEATPQNVFVTSSADTTQILVWQTQFARPARTAAVVRTLHERYNDMMQRSDIRDTFWTNIDDLSAKVAAQLTFPDRKTLETMRDAAIWLTGQTNRYSTDEATGDIINTERDQVVFNKKKMVVADSDITKFCFSVQQEIRDAIRENELTTADLRAKYEAVISSEADRAARARFRSGVDKFIEPMLFRIEQATTQN